MSSGLYTLCIMPSEHESSLQLEHQFKNTLWKRDTRTDFVPYVTENNKYLLSVR
jgi:hypothetical protein